MSSGISYNKRFTRLYELDNYNSRDQQVTFFDRQVLMMLLFLCCYSRVSCLSQQIATAWVIDVELLQLFITIYHKLITGELREVLQIKTEVTIES